MTAYNRLRGIISVCETAQNADDATLAQVQKQKAAVVDAVCDDLNFPLALGEMWTMAKLPACREIYDAAVELDKILGLELYKPLPAEKTDDVIPADVKAIAEKRFAARQNKDWATSDALRAELDGLGYSVLDSKTGYELKKK